MARGERILRCMSTILILVSKKRTRRFPKAESSELVIQVSVFFNIIVDTDDQNEQII